MSQCIRLRTSGSLHPWELALLHRPVKDVFRYSQGNSWASSRPRSRGAISMTQPEDYGFLTGFLRKVFSVLDEIPSRLFLGRRSELELPRDRDELKRYAQKGAVKVEIYVCSWVVDRKSTRLNSSHLGISYAVFCL